MKTNIRYKATLAGAFAALLGITCQASTVLIDETFADGNRGTQNPPSSLAWYSARPSSYLTATTGAMTMTQTSGANMAVSYFTNSGSPFSLSVGEKLTLTVNFYTTTLSGSLSGSGLRFGLLNSGGSRISSDNQGTSNSVYTNYTGYASILGNSNSNTQVATSAWDRTGTGNELMGTMGSIWTTSGNSTESASLQANTAYTLTMTLDYISVTNLTVTSLFTGGNLNGLTYSYVDSTPVTSFDTIAFWMGANPFTDMVFTSVNLTVVPEPATSGLLAGALCLVAAIIIRRRRR